MPIVKTRPVAPAFSAYKAGPAGFDLLVQDAQILSSFTAFLNSNQFPEDNRKRFLGLAKAGQLKATITRDKESGKAIVKLSAGEPWNNSYFYDGEKFISMAYDNVTAKAYEGEDVYTLPSNRDKLARMESWTDRDLKMRHAESEADKDDYGHPGHTLVTQPAPAFDLAQARKDLNAEIMALKMGISLQELKVAQPATYSVPVK